MKCSLFVRGQMPSLNEMIEAAKGAGGVGRYYARMKREWTEIVWAEAKVARLPVFRGPVFLTFTWHERGMRRDPDNVAAGGRKPILDGLVVAGIIRDDTGRTVTGFRDLFDWDATTPGVTIEIEATT